MNEYSLASLDRLSECHEDLQIVFSVVLQSQDHTILEGHRPKEKQNEYYATGRSKVKYPHGKHNKMPSMAVDAAPWPIPENWGEGDHEELRKFYEFGVRVVATADVLFLCGVIRHRIRWGGDWDRDNDTTDQTFNDLVHFELVED